MKYSDTRIVAKYPISLALVVMLFLTASTPTFAQSRIDSLLQKIDDAIEHKDEYVKKKTNRIGFLKAQLNNTRSKAAQYDLSYQLYEEYHPFMNDSAIYYLNRCADIAALSGDESNRGGCLALIALSCSNAGMYPEAESTLQAITPQKLKGINLGLYYYAYAHLSGEIAFYGNFATMRQQYSKTAEHYRILMMKHLPANHKYSKQCREMMAYDKGDLKRSLSINTQWLKNVKTESTEYALVTYYRYLEYKAAGDSIQMMYWLAQSVLSDIRNAVMDQGSMWEMANLLMTAGDVDRSYRYICFTSDCANRFGSRQRLSRISPLLSRIAQTYKTEVERKEQSLRNTLCAISIMAFLLLVALFYVYRKRTQLAATRDRLAQSNKQLHLSNTQLSELNAELSELNAKQATLNSQLAEANRIKEEYVGRFIRLCSIYIDKLSDLRKKVTRRVKNKQYAELTELTRSSEFKDRETTELYDNFDKAFLNLFPSFVSDFNALLKPEYQIVLTDNQSLNTVVRIFALIRLGITDSSKIAEFLHYSVNTIYNYRANIKNGAIGDRTEFENKVKLIGMPKESLH